LNLINTFGYTSSSFGAETWNIIHRLRNGSIIRLADSQQRIILHVAAYFSIVRRNECWASLVKFSASIKTIAKLIILTFYYCI
jgi:hypothetical protein